MNYLLAYYLLSPFILYIFFRIVMKFKGWLKDGKLNEFTYGIGMCFLFVGWTIDFFVNVTHASLIFWKPPKELTVTHRLRKVREDYEDGWMKTLAIKIMKHLAKHDKWGGHD
jgi:hypothetical protein